MSLWPVSPTNGQTTTVNGIVYTYNTTQTAWVRTGQYLQTDGGDFREISDVEV